MKLKNKKETIFFRNINFNSNLFYKAYFFLSLIILVIFFSLVINTGFWERNKSLIKSRAELNGVINYLQIPEILTHKFKSIFIEQKKIYLNISQKNIYKLEENRKRVLDYIELNNLSSRGHKTFYEVNASISDKGNDLKAKIRLKGDRTIHFENPNKSSYKLDLKDESFFKNMNKFSLQIPRIRNYIHEWIYHKLLNRGELVTINYDFYDVFINGQYKGYYALEEGFGKTLLERNKRRNGPIFSLFEEVKDDITKFEVYNENFWSSEENLDVTQKAVQNINLLLREEIDPNDVIDVKKWAWFLAVTDLTYTFHGALLKSVKFYYNPINEKIEPIGYDGHRLLPTFSKNILQYKPYLKKTLYDLSKEQGDFNWLKKILYPKGQINYDLYLEYLKAIEKIANDNFLDDFFKKNKKDINRINAGIYSDDYIYDYDHSRKSGIGIYYYDKKEIFERIDFLKNKYIINEAKIFAEINKDKIIINLFNDKVYLIDQIKLDCNFGKYENLDNIIYNNQQIEILNVDNKLFNNCNNLIFKNVISGKIKTVKLNKYNSFDDKNNFFKINNYKKYFKILEENQLVLKENSLIISDHLFIPKNFVVKIYPGQEIVLKDNAFIFSRSNWSVIGTNNQSINIKGSDDNFGGGILITDNSEISKFKNVNFKNLSGLKKSFFDKETQLYLSTITYLDKNNSKRFTEKPINLKNNKINRGNIIHGSINFNNTSVILKDITIENINSEDAINIFNSDFDLNRLSFVNNSSDAIDFDFSKGEIKNVLFERIGNDAIDFSGTSALISNIYFNNVGDKLISVGENSSVEIDNINAKESYLGIASKDGSKVKVEKVKFENVKIPFAAYNKKMEYDFPTLSVLHKGDKKFVNSIKDKTSILKLNGKNFGKVINDVYSLVYKRDYDLLFEN